MANTLKLDSLESIVEFLDSNPAGFLATLGTCGNPRVRPVQSALLYDGKIYFATSTKKNLYKHIQNHAGIEYCSCNSEGVFLRLRGKALEKQCLRNIRLWLKSMEVLIMRNLRCFICKISARRFKIRKTTQRNLRKSSFSKTTPYGACKFL